MALKIDEKVLMEARKARGPAPMLGSSHSMHQLSNVRMQTSSGREAIAHTSSAFNVLYPQVGSVQLKSRLSPIPRHLSTPISRKLRSLATLIPTHDHPSQLNLFIG